MEDVRKGILSSRSSVSASCIRPRKHNITPENNNEILKYVTKQKQLLLRLLTGDREITIQRTAKTYCFVKNAKT